MVRAVLSAAVLLARVYASESCVSDEVGLLQAQPHQDRNLNLGSGSSEAFCRNWKQQEENAQKKIAERDATIDLPERSITADQPVNYQAALLQAPYYPCLWDLEKTTPATVQADGGKWICGLRQLQERKTHRVVYSLGSNFDTSFENAMHKMMGDDLEIHIYDPTMGEDKKKLEDWKKGLPKVMHFHEEGVAGEGVKAEFPTVTLQEALQQNGHPDGIDILKFDIETYEYELVANTDWTKSKFGIISFELHSNLIERRLPGVMTDAKLIELFGKLEAGGYRLYSSELVCPGQGCAGQVELAWIHKDWDPRCGFSCSCSV